MFQQVMLVGRVGFVGTLRYMPTGTPFFSFTIATHFIHRENGAEQEETMWWRVTVWRERALQLHDKIVVGQLLLVIGRLGVYAYLDKNNRPRARLDLLDPRIEFLVGTVRGSSGVLPHDESDNVLGDDVPF